MIIRIGCMYVATVQKQLNIYIIPVTSLKSTVIVHVKPEMATAAESTMLNSFIHNGQLFIVLFIHAALHVCLDLQNKHHYYLICALLKQC